MKKILGIFIIITFCSYDAANAVAIKDAISNVFGGGSGSGNAGVGGSEKDGIHVLPHQTFNKKGEPVTSYSPFWGSTKQAIEAGALQLLKVDPSMGKATHYVIPNGDGTYEMAEEGDEGAMPVIIQRINDTSNPFAPFHEWKEDTLSTGGTTTETCGHEGLLQWNDKTLEFGGEAKAWRGEMDSQNYMYYRHPMETKQGAKIRTMDERKNKYATTETETYSKCIAKYPDKPKECKMASKWHSCRVPGSILEPFRMKNDLAWVYDKNEPEDKELAYTYDSKGKKYNEKGFTGLGLSWHDNFGFDMPPPYNISTGKAAPTELTMASNENGQSSGSAASARRGSGKYANNATTTSGGEQKGKTRPPEDWEPWRAHIAGPNSMLMPDGSNASVPGVKNNGGMFGEWPEIVMYEANAKKFLGLNGMPNYFLSGFYSGSSIAYVMDRISPKIPLVNEEDLETTEVDLAIQGNAGSDDPKHKNFKQTKQRMTSVKKNKDYPTVVTYPFTRHVFFEGAGGSGGEQSSSGGSGQIGAVTRSDNQLNSRYAYAASSGATSGGGSKKEKPKGLRFPAFLEADYPCKPGEKPKGKWPGKCDFVKEGGDEARAGDIIIWDGSKNRRAHTAFVESVTTKDGQTCMMISEQNNGVVGDAAGNTEAWGRVNTRQICKKKEKSTFALKGNKELPDCTANPQAERCQEKGWKKLRIYKWKEDDKRRTNPKTGEMENAGECKSLNKQIEKDVDKIRGEQTGGYDGKDKKNNHSKQAAKNLKKAISLGCSPTAKFMQPYAGGRAGSRTLPQYTPIAPGEPVKQADYIQKSGKDNPFKIFGQLPIPSLFKDSGGGSGNNNNSTKPQEPKAPPAKTCGQVAVEASAKLKLEANQNSYTYKEGCAGGTATPGSSASCNGKQFSREGFIYAVYGGYGGGLGNLSQSTPSAATLDNESIVAFKNIHENESKEVNGCRITNLGSCAKVGDVVLVQSGNGLTSTSPYNRFLIYAGNGSFYEAQPNGGLIRLGSLPPEYSSVSYEVRRLSCNN